MYDRKKELETWIAGRDPLEQATYHVVKEDILKIAKKFDNTGQSGFSAPMMAGIVADLTKKMMLKETLNPITEETVDWACGHFEENKCQSRAEASLFKDTISGDIYYLDGIIFGEKDVKYSSFTGNGVLARDEKGKTYKIGSSVHNLKFPIVPKSFKIFVAPLEINGEEYYICELRDLREVFAHYKVGIEDLGGFKK